MSTAPHALVSRLYYSLDRSQAAADVQGDALLQLLYRPLIEALRAALPGAQISWMRFCSQGYHLRLHVLDAADELSKVARPLIEARVAAFIATQPQFFRTNPGLPELAQAVSQTFAAGQPLLPAGSHRIDVQTPQAAEDPGAAALQTLLMLESWQSLRVLERLSGYRQRLLFWRFYSLHLLQLLALEPTPAAQALADFATRWQHKFALVPTALRQRQAELPGSAYLAGLLRQGRPAASSPALPPAMAECLRELAQAQLQALDTAQRFTLRANRQDLLALLHLGANRLGISVLDEAAHAFALAQALHQGAEDRAPSPQECFA